MLCKRFYIYFVDLSKFRDIKNITVLNKSHFQFVENFVIYLIQIHRGGLYTEFHLQLTEVVGKGQLNNGDSNLIYLEVEKMTLLNWFYPRLFQWGYRGTAIYERKKLAID